MSLNCLSKRVSVHYDQCSSDASQLEGGCNSYFSNSSLPLIILLKHFKTSSRQRVRADIDRFRLPSLEVSVRQPLLLTG